MRVKLLWAGSVLATVAMCHVGTWLYGLGVSCPPALGAVRCQHRTMLLDTLFMVLPLGGLLLRCVYTGLRQYRKTGRAVHYVLALGTRPLPPTVLPLAQSLGIAARIDVVAWSRAEAFCYGVLRPRICISTGLLAALELDEVEAVLRHERHHVRRRDPLRTLLWSMLCSVCWWLEEHAAHANLVRELAADRAVMEAQGRPPLARALLKVVAQTRDDGLRDLAISGLSVTNARIEQVLKPGQHTTMVQMPAMSRWMVAPLALLTYVLICSVIMAHA